MRARSWDDDLKTKWDGAVLKSATDDWAQGGKGSDLYGFTLLPACGRASDGECGDDGYCGVLAAEDGKIFFDNISVVEIRKWVAGIHLSVALRIRFALWSA